MNRTLVEFLHILCMMRTVKIIKRTFPKCVQYTNYSLMNIIFFLLSFNKYATMNKLERKSYRYLNRTVVLFSRLLFEIRSSVKI